MKSLTGIMGAIITLFALVGGVWSAKEYLASAADLENAKQQITKDTIQTFEKFQMKMDYRFNTQQLFLLKDREYKILEEMRKNPSNVQVREEHKQVVQEITDLKKAINEDKGK